MEEAAFQRWWPCGGEVSGRLREAGEGRVPTGGCGLRVGGRGSVRW